MYSKYYYITIYYKAYEHNQHDPEQHGTTRAYVNNPGYFNEAEGQEEDLKMIQDFKEDMNISLKKIQENTFKQVESLKEEANEFKEIQENTTKQEEDVNKTV